MTNPSPYANRASEENRLTRSYLRTVERSANQRWPTDPAVRAKLVEGIRDILDDPTDSRYMAAAAALIAIEKQNQADEHLEIKNQNDRDTVKPPALTQINNYFAAGEDPQARLEAFKKRMLDVTAEKPPDA